MGAELHPDKKSKPIKYWVSTVNTEGARRLRIIKPGVFLCY
jgi:hypothetical protein